MHSDCQINTVSVRSCIRVFLALMPVLIILASITLTHADRILIGGERKGDHALILLNVEKAKRFEAIDGAYSRFRFHHPSPFVFYVYASLSKISFLQTDEGGEVALACFLVNSSLLLLIAFMFWRHGGSISYAIVVISFVCLILFRVKSSFLYDFWNPSATVIPIICLITCSALIGLGNFGYIWLWALSLVLALSNHISTLPVCITITVVTVVLVFVRRPAKVIISPVTGSLSFFIIVAALFPVLADFVRDPQASNVCAVFRYFLNRKHENTLSSLESLRYISSFFLLPFKVNNFTNILFFVFVQIFPFFFKIDRESIFYNLRLLILSSTLVSIVSAHFISGKPFHFILMYHYGLSALSYALCVSLVVYRSKGRFGKFLEGSVFLCFFFLAFFSITGLAMQAKHPVSYPVKEKIRTLEMPSDKMIIVKPITHGSWQHAATVVSYLYKNGYQTCVPKVWGFMFGKDLVCKKNSLEDAVILRVHYDLQRKVSISLGTTEGDKFSLGS